MSALNPQAYETGETDGRGRLSVGRDRAGAELTYVVLDPDTLDRLSGPDTKTVNSDGRLSLGPDFADTEVSVGILSVDDN